ncbi:MAG: GNAT family N-acetyltransferase [Geitlerinemataceae cyanobacterium]
MGDVDALFAIHKAAMSDYVDRIWDWEDVWQQQNFAKNFSVPANRRVLCECDRPIGWWCWTSSQQSIFINAIALHPAHQRQGLGSCILNWFVAQSEASDTKSDLVKSVRAMCRPPVEVGQFSETLDHGRGQNPAAFG